MVNEFLIIALIRTAIYKIKKYTKLIIDYKMSKDKSSQLLDKEEEESQSSLENPFDQKDNVQESKPKKKKEKRIKKVKKSVKPQKKNKAKVREVEHDDDEENQNDQLNSMFDDEAESGEEDYDDEEYEAEAGFQEQRELFQKLYKEPKATQRLLEKLHGKNQKQINAQYSKRAHIIQQESELFPSQKDPKLYVVHVKFKHEDEMALTILNKAKCLINTQNKVSIVSVISLRKKFPGKIFVQAFSERDIYQSLEGFNNVLLGKKLVKLQNEGYISLFQKCQAQKNEFEINTYVRVRKGLYEGDLAKIFKIKKNSIQVVIVPRISVQDIIRTIRENADKLRDEKEIVAKKEEILKLFTDHRVNNYRERPSKRPIYIEDLNELKDCPGIKNIRLSNSNGLIVLSYRADELTKVYGTYLPIEIMPFTRPQKLMAEITREQGEKIVPIFNFKVGQSVEIVSGELAKHYGILMEIRDKIGIIKCKNKEMKDAILSQPLQNLSKKFREGQRVKIISGIDEGKTGIILKIQDKMITVWTNNSNTININKKCLQLYHGQNICTQNIHQLKKNDIIKTNLNIIGIVLESNKDHIKIIDTNNVMQIINNLDFKDKININHLIAKNKYHHQLKSGSLVIILNGANQVNIGVFQGKRCRIIHVYKQFVFLFNENFHRTCGILVEVADNCSIVSKNDTGKVRLSTKTMHVDQEFNQNEEISVGMTITLKNGPLKGYNGIVKSINKEKIEVRVLSKAHTQWVPRKTLATKQEQQKEDSGKTPNINYNSFRGFDKPSPINFDQ